MSLNSFFLLLFSFLFILVLFRNLNIFVDETRYSEHKRIGKENNKPLVIGGLFLILSILYFLPSSYIFIKIFCVILFFLGFLSDRNYLSNPKIRLILQVIILIFLVYFENLSIKSININFFDNLLKINFINIVFTVFCLSILLNGSNFIDGLNGLVSGYYLIVLLSIFYLNYNFSLFHAISIIELDLIKVLIFSLFIFFIFNIFGLVYLGDSGSYLIALLLGIILIKNHSQNDFISPFYVVNMLWYPAFENLFSLIRRFYSKKNISLADKYHLHQMIYRFFKSKKTSKIINLNSLSALIILFFILFGAVLSSIVYWHTSYLVLILFFNISIYLLVYFLISKNFNLNK